MRIAKQTVSSFSNVKDRDSLEAQYLLQVQRTGFMTVDERQQTELVIDRKQIESNYKVLKETVLSI